MRYVYAVLKLKLRQDCSVQAGVRFISPSSATSTSFGSPSRDCAYSKLSRGSHRIAETRTLLVSIRISRLESVMVMQYLSETFFYCNLR